MWPKVVSFAQKPLLQPLPKEDFFSRSISQILSKCTNVDHRRIWENLKKELQVVSGGITSDQLIRNATLYDIKHELRLFKVTDKISRKDVPFYRRIYPGVRMEEIEGDPKHLYMSIWYLLDPSLTNSSGRSKEPFKSSVDPLQILEATGKSVVVYDHNHPKALGKENGYITEEWQYPSPPGKDGDMQYIPRFGALATVSTRNGLTFTDPGIKVKDMPNFKRYQHRLLTLYYAAAVAREIVNQKLVLKEDPNLFRLSMGIARFALSEKSEGDSANVLRFIRDKLPPNNPLRDKLFETMEDNGGKGILVALGVKLQKYREIVALEEGLILCYLTRDMLDTLGVLYDEPDITWKKILEQVEVLSEYMNGQETLGLMDKEGKFKALPENVREKLENPSDEKLRLLLSLMRAIKYGVPMGLFKFRNEPLFEIFRKTTEEPRLPD